jgi:hypothetical protein
VGLVQFLAIVNRPIRQIRTQRHIFHTPNKKRKALLS